MKKVVLFAGIMLVACRVFGGFVLTVENDVFLKDATDHNYTHGMEAMWTQVSDGRWGYEVVRESYGLRTRMYSPDDITNPNPPPSSSHPWAGLTSAYGEWWFMGGKVGDMVGSVEAVKYGLDVGILGPDSGCRWMQTEFHKLIGSAKPMGWKWQMPNEPAINAYMDRYIRAVSIGEQSKLLGTVDLVYGGILGTTFIEGKGGLSGRFGWNMPPTPVDNIVGPKMPRGVEKLNGFFGGLILDVNGWWQGWNSTIGDSMFRSSAEREALQRDLESWVGEYSYGAIMGCGNFSLTYRKTTRSDEFEGQSDKQSWGMVSITFGRVF